MNNYEYCKKWIEYSNNMYYKGLFYQYINATPSEWLDFCDFMNNKYGDWSSNDCQNYIDKINYIKGKLL